MEGRGPVSFRAISTGLGLRKKRVSDGTEISSVFDLAVALEALFAETR